MTNFRAEDARQLLENALFKEAFDKVGEYLEMQALNCEPDNKERAQRIVMSKQLLLAIKREIQRVVEDGEIAEIEALEKRKGIKKFLR